MGYRNQLQAKTTSKNKTVREIYHQYTVFLENLWALHNMEEAKRRRTLLDQMEGPLVRVKDFTIDFGYFILRGYSLGPPK